MKLTARIRYLIFLYGCSPYGLAAPKWGYTFTPSIQRSGMNTDNFTFQLYVSVLLLANLYSDT